MKFLVLGATGMAGHVISIYLRDSGHDVYNFSRKSFGLPNEYLGDVTDFKTLKDIIDEGNYDIIVNCIGILNQEAENNKDLAVLLNSYLPMFLKKITENTATRLIHISTDCVFSGEKGYYKEDDFPDGKKFYDRSKSLGEINDDINLTIRTSIIGPDIDENGIGLFNWFMKQKSDIEGYKNVYWSGITTIELAKAIEKASINRITGIYHLVSATEINKYELLRIFNDIFNDEKIFIKENQDAKSNKVLVNTRKDFIFSIPSYYDMIREMKKWICKNEILYKHYLRS